MIVVAISIGAVAGACLRAAIYLFIDGWSHNTRWPASPPATAAVNILGSFALGLITGLSTDHMIHALVVAFVGTGFCGSLTTFSTYAFDTFTLARNRNWRMFGLFGVALPALAFLAASIGLLLGLKA